jgi:dihydropteroate synthase
MLASSWTVRDRVLPLSRPVVVGILNVTPDSFSDGGRYAALDDALARAERMLDEGADVIDVGGESTRPGAAPVDEAEERGRAIPVVREIVARHPTAMVSIDTVKASVADAAIDAGAQIVNDVSGGRIDPSMRGVVARGGAGYVVMHSRGDVATMARYDHADYADVVEEVHDELRALVDAAIDAGVRAASIVVDPGIGFAKRAEHSLAILGALPRFAAWGHPVLVGVSRKRFIGELTHEPDAEGRVHGTAGANVAALALGARIFRVHDVRASRQALDVASAVLRAARPASAALETPT